MKDSGTNGGRLVSIETGMNIKSEGIYLEIREAKNEGSGSKED